MKGASGGGREGAGGGGGGLLVGGKDGKGYSDRLRCGWSFLYGFGVVQ